MTEAWIVTDVVDGDTLDVLMGDRAERIRVVGIDTPEEGECGFDEATEAMADSVLGERVILLSGAQDDRDRYDRLLRYVDRESDGFDAGLALINAGLATARYDSRDGYGEHAREQEYVANDEASPPSVTCEEPPAEEEPEPPAPPAPDDPPAEEAEPEGDGPPYQNCDAVRAAGAAPIREGDPGFESKFDGDGDGVGCEP